MANKAASTVPYKHLTRVTRFLALSVFLHLVTSTSTLVYGNPPDLEMIKEALEKAKEAQEDVKKANEAVKQTIQATREDKRVETEQKRVTNAQKAAKETQEAAAASKTAAENAKAKLAEAERLKKKAEASPHQETKNTLNKSAEARLNEAQKASDKARQKAKEAEKARKKAERRAADADTLYPLPGENETQPIDPINDKDLKDRMDEAEKQADKNSETADRKKKS